MRKVVLVVGMLDSVHLARWLEVFGNSEIDFWLFPSSPSRRLHPLIKSLIQNESHAKFRAAFPALGALPLILWCFDKLFSNRIRSTILRRKIRTLNPHLIHALELQNAGYLVVDTLKRMNSPDRPTFVATNYGSDLFWFRQFESHRKRLTELLSMVDRYAAECQRDVEIAREMGFEGATLPVVPNFGGIEFRELTFQTAPAARNRIAVKGYHGWVGRAHVALRALKTISQEISQFEIVVYSSNFSTRVLAAWVALRTGLRITTFRKNALSTSEMRELFSASRIYIGLSRSDGISTSLIESMAYGAIPVQSATSCCDEWFDETGAVVREITEENVAAAVRKALELSLSGNAAQINAETVQARASREEIASKVKGFYS